MMFMQFMPTHLVDFDDPQQPGAAFHQLPRCESGRRQARGGCWQWQVSSGLCR